MSFTRILHNIYYPTFLLKKPSILAVLVQKLKSIMGKKRKKSLALLDCEYSYLSIRILETEARIRELNMCIFHKDFWPYMWQI